MNLNELVERIEQGAEVVLKWSVLPEIGPNWIGGGRTITVQVDGQPLAEHTPAAKALIKALIDTMNLPEESPVSALVGTGGLELQGDWLVLDFQWNNAPPYEDGDFDFGEVHLIRRS